MSKIPAFLRSEYSMLLAWIAFILLNFVFTDLHTIKLSTTALVLYTFAILLVMVLCSFNVVKHADRLGRMLGEPYGTIILTLSVISIEVMLIVSMMLLGKGNPTLARDTMLAVIMISINGFFGLSLLVGGVKNGRQTYNTESGSTYISMLIPLATASLILPNYTVATHGGTLSVGQSIIIVTICILLYITFLVKQTITHQDHFKYEPHIPNIPNAPNVPKQKGEGNSLHGKPSVYYSCILLILSLSSMILLSKNIAYFLGECITKAHLPIALVGVILALLVIMPEGLSAVQAAYKNQLQRAINLCMGSAIATICLTVPAVVLVTMMLHTRLILGLGSSDIVLMVLTFFISLITFTSRKTSILNGMVLLSIFVLYLLLVFDIPH